MTIAYYKTNLERILEQAIPTLVDIYRAFSDKMIPIRFSVYCGLGKEGWLG